MRLAPILAALTLLVSLPAWASRSSYRNAHPVAWMHLLPVGETPGWSTGAWMSLEHNHANIWNMQSTMTDTRTGDVYTYKADFEQSTAILDFGWAVSDSWALAFEVPYANRNGGFLDDFIDQFHQAIDSDRFLRHLNEPFGNSFIIRRNGVDMLATERADGISNMKVKLKYWALKWRSSTPGACECGLAFSGQVKFPTQPRKKGLSSGTNDYSALVHLGAPLFKYAGAYATAAVTRTGLNETFAGWPRRDWLQMYELTLDLGFNKNLGLILQARAESPLMNRKHLRFNHTYSDPNSRSAERVASGWNSLVEWRGSQSLGLRWNWGKGNQINLMIIEDWGIGDVDNRGDRLYVNNAPDVAFIMQWHFVF